MDIDKIRISSGSAIALELLTNRKIDTFPTTCYLMTYYSGKCTSNCSFCPQARTTQGSLDKLSRVNWPIFQFNEFLIKLKYMRPSRKFKRICIQTLNYPNNFKDIIEIITEIKKETSIPISTAIPPMNKNQLKELKIIGVERVGIALDAATEEIFEKIKGKGVKNQYSWKEQYQNLIEATKIFSNSSVSTHIIYGLGDTQEQILNLMYELKKYEILTALFAFMPIKDTKLETLKQPNIHNFRKLQLARDLIANKDRSLEDITFNSKGEIISFNINKQELMNIIDENIAFRTSGCFNCNRPYYTSTPSGPFYNYPRLLDDQEKKEIFNQLKNLVKF
ncbi:MAG: radical SAM protein [Candidatus Lokiarchaeota archaeon]|nr:radical SAM protein [Candidatus Lokiarchaeota archaeon]